MTLDLSVYPQLLTALLPELVLSVWGVILLLVVAWRHRTARDLRVTGWLTLVALATTAVSVWWLWWHSAHSAGSSAMIAVDDFRFVADWLFLGAALLTVLFSSGYLEREGLLAPEYYVLLVFATLGMMLMGGGEDLMVIFLGLELMSICLYALAGLNRRSPRAAEAGLKYFLLGAFASAFLLYGIALVYGATGTTNLSLVGAQVVALQLQRSPLLLLGVALLLIGFGFKVAAVPFHMWVPDVYDGSPTPVAGYMATAVKAAAFAALFRVVGEALAPSPAGAWREIVAGLAITTMVAGNLVALAQRSLKRMLAYSSVAHAGYLLVAVATGVAAGSAAFVFYLVAYSLTTLAAFATLAAKGRGGESDVQIDDLAGLAAQRPWLAFALSVCMLSLLGFPGTAGFIGKWYILVAAMSTGQGWLAALLVLTSVVSAGYYLPVVMAMYMKPAPSTEAHAAVCLDGRGRVAMAVAVAGLLVFGVAPNRLLDLSKTSGATVQHGAAPGGGGRHRGPDPLLESLIPGRAPSVHVPATIFRQYDIRGTVGDQLTAAVAHAIAAAVTTLGNQRLGRAPRLAVGRDNRPSGAALADSVRTGIVAAGGTALDVGECPTPALYFATHTLEVDGGVQVTGSHNPPEFNGFKLVLGDEPIYGEEIQGLREMIEDNRTETRTGGRHAAHGSLLTEYRDAIVARNAPLTRRLKVVVDCGNGVGSLIAIDTLRRLGAEVVPLFAESDGTFPHHHPDPTVLENLRDLQAAVVKEQAELGIAFDGDGDRIGAVDERGAPVFGDQLLVLFGRDLARRFGPGKPVIFDVKCSEVLPQMLQRAGLVPMMWKTGHSLIKQKMKETGAALAGEMSGHVFFGGDWFGFDDALFAAARLLSYVAREGGPLSRLLADLPRTVSTPELRVDCPDERKFDVVERAARHFAAKYTVSTLDGVRITFAEGWGLLRASNTQPALVLRFEATSDRALAAYRAEVEGWLAANGVRA